MKQLYFALGVLCASLPGYNLLMGQRPPYPPSDLIDSIEWDYASHRQEGLGSDQWPLTWGSDDQLYAAWGDGWGWDSLGIKRSMGVTRILGSPPDLRGHDLWGMGPGQGVAKPEALIALRDTLWMFWTAGDSKYEDPSSLAYSYDFGETWVVDTLPFLPTAPPGFRVRGICQFGPGYRQAVDAYVYLYWGFNRQEALYLARVPRQALANADRYSWFAGLDADGMPRWKAFDQKRPAFYDANAYLWHIGISYHPQLKRYLLSKPHYTDKDNRETIFAPKTRMSSLGIFEAPNPWGPWRTVVYQDDFRDELVKFSYFIPTKFMHSTDHSFWLLWSGWPEYDNVNFLKGRLVLRK